MKSNNVYLHRIINLIIVLFMFSSCTDAQNYVKTKVSPVDLVYPLLDSENSRWFFFSSACRPFGMVNLSPDTEIDGAWGSGYRYNTDTIKGFSHIHAWQLAGLSVMPVTISDSNVNSIFNDYESKFSHKTEKIFPGFHYVQLERYGVNVSLTSTKRVGLHKYQYPEGKKSAVLFNLNLKLGPSEIIDGTLEKVGSRMLSGKVVNAPTQRRPKKAQIFFQIELNTEIDSIIKDDLTGNYLVLLADSNKEVIMKAGISYTSVENAKNNIEQELSHWDFDQIVTESRLEWNKLLSRIEVTGGTNNDRRRFYTDLWHALQGRRTISDFNGSYPDNTGKQFRVGQLPLDEKGNPKFNHYNSDSFWGAQWTLNTLWGLVYPEIMEEFVHSLMQYYEDGGLIPRGPSGGNYTYVMSGASSTPFIVSAIQKGIIKNDLEEIYEALRKNHMPGGIMERAGYEHNTMLGGGLKYYLKNGFVPYPIPDGNFGMHQDGASLTLEYAYQDWTLAQLAKKLGKDEDYEYFLTRSKNYKNIYDPESGWMRTKNHHGEWTKDFDPYNYKEGYIEANSAQVTWFVPHDIGGLADLMGGDEKAVLKLNEQFETAQKLGFTSGDKHELEEHPEYRRIPINYGNQPSMQTAYVFSKINRSDLTQYWSRKVVDAVYSGVSTSRGYNGDEDQGLMGSLAVLYKIGLFQMNGGTEENPEYQIGSTIFDKITIELNPNYYPGKSFTINAINNSNENVYVNKVVLNKKLINSFNISHDDIVSGGNLNLEMADKLKEEN